MVVCRGQFSWFQRIQIFSFEITWLDVWQEDLDSWRDFSEFFIIGFVFRNKTNISTIYQNPKISSDLVILSKVSLISFSCLSIEVLY